MFNKTDIKRNHRFSCIHAFELSIEARGAERKAKRERKWIFGIQRVKIRALVRSSK